MARKKHKRRERTNANVPAKGRLRDIADHLWSRAVKDDWANKCAMCGTHKPRLLEAHHIIPRHHEQVRYDLNNGICLCFRCHKHDDDHAPHQNAAGWLLWLSDYHHTIHRWYIETTESGEHRNFDGTTSADYYCDQIRRLKQYVDGADYVRIVGQRFSAWLDAESER